MGLASEAAWQKRFAGFPTGVAQRTDFGGLVYAAVGRTNHSSAAGMGDKDIVGKGSRGSRDELSPGTWSVMRRPPRDSAVLSRDRRHSEGGHGIDRADRARARTSPARSMMTVPPNLHALTHRNLPWGFRELNGEPLRTYIDVRGSLARSGMTGPSS